MNGARRGLLSAGAAGVGALLGACSPVRLINALSPARTYRADHALAYGEHPRQRLDVYRPSSMPVAAPLVMFFYGGHWKSGAREDYLFVGEALASKGYVAVIADYRLHPEVRFPEFLEDCARAVAWSLARAAQFGAGERKLVLMGHSAGAYNAAMLALDTRYLGAAGVEQHRVRGLVGLAGPYDFIPLSTDTSKAIFGFPDTPPQTQPIYFASERSPPALLVTGADDSTVDPRNTQRLAARLRDNGVRVRELVYPDLSHLLLLGSLASPLRWRAPVLDDVASFIGSAV